jgi:hypothetical protein
MRREEPGPRITSLARPSGTNMSVCLSEHRLGPAVHQSVYPSISSAKPSRVGAQAVVCECQQKLLAFYKQTAPRFKEKEQKTCRPGDQPSETNGLGGDLRVRNKHIKIKTDDRVSFQKPETC